MKLPILKKVSVKNLSLYTRPIDMKIHPGINLIIGGNGIGKTTLVNTILFALVGNATYERFENKSIEVPLVHEGYFKGRIETKDQDYAEVTLTIGIDKSVISITRALYRSRILEVIVKETGKDDHVLRGKPDDLEAKYRSLIQSKLEINAFEDFVFIVANLLLFDEERRTLAWDSEVQNRLLRLLFLPKDFDEKVSKYSHQFTHNDTLGRHKSEERKNIRREIDRWLKDKEEMRKHSAAKSGDSDTERNEAEIRLAELQRELSINLDDTEQITTQLDTEVNQLRSLNVEADNIELQRLPLMNQLTELENTFYQNVYETVSHDYVIILEGLVKRGICQFCGTENDRLKKIGKELKREGQCIVCRSPVRDKLQPKEDNSVDGLAERINSIREHIDRLDMAQADCTNAQASAKAEINRLQGELSNKNRNRRHVETEIITLRSKTLASSGEQSDATADKDSWLEKQYSRIEDLNRQVDEYYRKRDSASMRLKEFNDTYLSRLHDINENLTPLFSHFASRFLGTTCELVVSHKTKLRKPVVYMYPMFNGKERANIDQVSESQRFFIDQAFRMALITWFTDISGHPTFCIVETPEGSLDLVYERNVSEMYAEFGTHKHSIIATSNLNSSNFLVGLVKQLGSPDDRRSRVLDLLKYGRLTQVQEDRKSDFNKRLKQLELPLI